MSRPDSVGSVGEERHHEDLSRGIPESWYQYQQSQDRQSSDTPPTQYSCPAYEEPKHTYPVKQSASDDLDRPKTPAKVLLLPGGQHILASDLQAQQQLQLQHQQQQQQQAQAYTAYQYYSGAYLPGGAAPTYYLPDTSQPTYHLAGAGGPTYQQLYQPAGYSQHTVYPSQQDYFEHFLQIQGWNDLANQINQQSRPT